MNSPERLPLPDEQSQPDTRRLALRHVGVKGLRYPVALLGADGSTRHTVAMWNLGVSLAPELKGTHMSRFVELLEAHRSPLSQAGLLRMLIDMLDRLGARSGRIEAAFPYFVRKQAPVSGVESLLDYEVALVAEQEGDKDPVLTLRLQAPVASLCPCSKKISAYGAHNQRSLVTLEVQLLAFMPIEELVRIAEEEASCQLYGLLKRPDEKWVTERAYENPKFVEDLARDLALRLMADPRIGSWKVACENFESIHNHSAYAELCGVNA